MKYALFAALSLASVYASAQENVNVAGPTESSIQTQKYNQHKGIDVARVISTKPAQDPQKADGLVNVQMIYVDHAGQTRTLDYTIQGYGQQNG